MRLFFDRMDLWLTPLRFVAIVLGCYVAIDLTGHLYNTWHIRRHALDGLTDPRVLRSIRVTRRRRVRADEMQDVGDGY